MVHIGQEIKKKAKELRIGPTELARLINVSKQNVYHIFERKSVDIELLKTISTALNHDFFQLLYIDEHEENKLAAQEKVIIEQAEKIKRLESANLELVEMIAELKKQLKQKE